MSKKVTFQSMLEQDQQNSEQTEVDFAAEMKGIKPLTQDKLHFRHNTNKRAQDKQQSEQRRNKLVVNDQAKSAQRFQFSDEYEPFIDDSQTLSFVREGYPSYLTKVLRRGDVAPELILDLHGYTKQQAQKDIADLVIDCMKQHIPCACIVHGVSGGILKRKVPHYLMQHPDVLAFHQAPLEWGGQGAVVLIINLGEELTHLLGRDL
ncbi:endonuclease SmrB [Psychrosphaera haliotis]|uniref:endonuclease SmrB n=1 Tax=Psychrosphaera haliotis TaxID=555083 RepID=UPI00236929EE|nr:endonuclease SmrB [Psychrosphaera haliotis]